MLEPGYEQPGHLLVFTDDRHIDRANVLMFQTPAIIPVVQIRRMRLAIGVHDEVGGELQCTGGALYQPGEAQAPEEGAHHSAPDRGEAALRVAPAACARRAPAGGSPPSPLSG